MANIKISELNSLSKKDYEDVLPIVDTSANETKKISIEELINNNVSLLTVSSTAPSECSTGDKYFNTTTNLIYTATGTDTWSEIGEEPIEGIFYIVFDKQSTYAYNGTTLVSVGGGAGGGEALPVGSEIDFDGQISDIPVGWEEITNPDSYSTDEIKTNKTGINGKPIYRKTIVYTSPLPSGNTSISHGITNLDTITDFKINYYTASNTMRKDQYIDTSYYICVNNINNTSVVISVGPNYNNAFTKTIITLEYTKATD